MARYIDAEEVEQRLLYYVSHTTERSREHYAYNVALREVKYQPEADVEEVKRCKNGRRQA